jgi:cold shock CspA family protein
MAFRITDRNVCGCVTTFDSRTGRGVIRCDSGGDVFVHWTAISGRAKRLEPEMAVVFDIASAKRMRPRAVNVRVSLRTRHATAPATIRTTGQRSPRRRPQSATFAYDPEAWRDV